MFGHQDDEHHHHDGDNQPLNDAAMQPAVDHVLSTENNGGTTVQEDFNPALPPAEPVNDAPTTDAPSDVAAVSDDLLNIKQQALTALSPLVGHLDQSPEEKFRTTMMLIQASDNRALIKDAYHAAEAIPDEKVKAQALLDVVNEINYFTSQEAA